MHVLMSCSAVQHHCQYSLSYAHKSLATVTSQAVPGTCRGVPAWLSETAVCFGHVYTPLGASLTSYSLAIPPRPRLPPSETASALALAVALALHAPMNLFLQPREPQAKPLASASALAADMASPPLAPAKAEALAVAAASHSLGRGARRLPLLKSSMKVLTVAVASAVAVAPAGAASRIQRCVWWIGQSTSASCVLANHAVHSILKRGVQLMHGL
jgi:hypothetical protein